MELVRCVSCTLLSLLISLGTSLITWWCVWVTVKDGHLSLNAALSKLWRENMTPILPEEGFCASFGVLFVDA